MNNLVSVQWLRAQLKDQDLVILDASLAQESSAGIPGAKFMELKTAFASHESDLPNTFPSAEQFEEECQKLGINSNSKIVVYDQKGIFSSPRAWWLFKTFGHEQVAVLDGGLPEWLNQGYSTAGLSHESTAKGNFKAELKKDHIKFYEDVLKNTQDRAFTVVDARSKGRFEGTTPEPREGLLSGCIPASVSLPYTEVLHKGLYKSPEQLRQIFEDLNLLDKNLVFSCGSGISACIILLAREQVQRGDLKIYDGSWTEWAIRQELLKK